MEAANLSRRVGVPVRCKINGIECVIDQDSSPQRIEEDYLIAGDCHFSHLKMVNRFTGEQRASMLKRIYDTDRARAARPDIWDINDG